LFPCAIGFCSAIEDEDEDDDDDEFAPSTKSERLMEQARSTEANNSSTLFPEHSGVDRRVGRMSEAGSQW